MPLANRPLGIDNAVRLVRLRNKLRIDCIRIVDDLADVISTRQRDLMPHFTHLANNLIVSFHGNSPIPDYQEKSLAS